MLMIDARNPYNQHKQDDKDRLQQERVVHLQSLKQNKLKVARDTKDAHKITSQGDESAIMKKLHLELSYQKKVIYGEMSIPSLDELFRIRKFNRVTNKYLNDSTDQLYH